jgi:hypothetical protein
VVTGGLEVGVAVMRQKGGSPVLRPLALASVTLLTPALVSAETTKFRIEEATLEDIQTAIRGAD